MGLLDGIFGGEFDGREAKIKVSDNGGRTDIYYGGADKPDGDGHGHEPPLMTKSNTGGSRLMRVEKP